MKTLSNLYDKEMRFKRLLIKNELETIKNKNKLINKHEAGYKTHLLYPMQRGNIQPHKKDVLVLFCFVILIAYQPSRVI